MVPPSARSDTPFMASCEAAEPPPGREAVTNWVGASRGSGAEMLPAVASAGVMVATGANPSGAPARADVSCGGERAVPPSAVVSGTCIGSDCVKAADADGCRSIGNADVAYMYAAASAGGVPVSEKAPGGISACAGRWSLPTVAS